MSLVMITGGVRSGKSEFAEQLALEKGGNSVLYIATSIPFDEEMKERVRRHKERRPPFWQTKEVYKDLYDVISKSNAKVALIDCLTVMITNLLMEVDLTWENAGMDEIDNIENQIADEVDEILTAKKDFKGDIILVTNEVGMGLVPEYKLGRIFRDIAGRMNKKVADAADEVYLMVSGIPLKIKG